VTTRGDAGGDRARAPVATAADGHWCWSGTAGEAHFVFYGKACNAESGGERAIEAALERSGIGLATMRQIHSARILDARPGPNGDGDALIARGRSLALRVVTADCVPVLLAGPEAIAAVHAGWRGLAAGILEAAVAALGDGERPLRALIGPSIGGCCYEVGPDVAEALAKRAGSAGVILDRGPGRRPHLDLGLAARLELGRAGVEQVTTIDACTRCDAERLWSYRREGKRAGRNVALIWRERESS
jgi:YfiH family protein